MATNNSFSMQRVMTLIKQDKKFFLYPSLAYALILMFQLPAFVINARYSIQAGDSLQQNELLWGGVLPINSVNWLLIASIYVCSYFKFSPKNNSKSYRLYPATSTEKCTNIIADYILAIILCLIIKIISCVILGLCLNDSSLGIDAIKGMFTHRSEGYGMITAPLVSKWSFDAPGHLLSYSFWPMEKIGIPWPIETGDVILGHTMMGDGIIHDWTPYPLLAFGLNVVDFLISSFLTILLTAMFAIVKTNKKFRQTIEGKIVLCFVALLILASAEAFLLDSHHIGYFFGFILTLLYAIGPWCWMSMFGWMIQAAILLVFNALAIRYMYYKIKSI